MEVNSLLFQLLFVVASLAAILEITSGSQCPSIMMSPDDNSMCCNNITVSNVSNTAVLLEWSLSPTNGSNKGPPSEGDSGGNPVGAAVVTSYVQVMSSLVNNSIVTIGSADSITVGSGSSVVLVALQKDSCYRIQVYSGSSVCCQTVFKTSDTVASNQVTRVQSHVYGPIQSAGSNISAQITWERLNMSGLIGYDVSIRTADKNMANITDDSLFNISSQTTFANVVTRSPQNELIYPLELNRVYITMVRGRTRSTVDSWSEPIWINTTGDVPLSGLYVTQPNTARLLSYSDVNNTYSTVLTNSKINQPFALDKRNRLIFHFNSKSKMITRENLGRPFSSEEIHRFDNVNITAMAFDWISQKLYIATSTGSNNTLYSLLIHGRESDHVLTKLLSISDPIADMTVNPFTGYVHVTHSNGMNLYQLKRINMTTLQTVDITGADKLSRSTVTENVERNCVYVIGSNNTVITVGEDMACSTGDFSLQVSSQFLAADEGGVFAASNSGNLLYYDYEDNQVASYTLDLDGLTALVATSPGTQPLPDQSCLSPVIRSTNVSTQRTSSSVVLEWNPPMIDVKSNCMGVVASLPPLSYSVEVSTNGTLVYEQTLFDTRVNITMLDSSLKYNVVIRAGNEFTVGESTSISSITINEDDSSTDGGSVTPTSTMNPTVSPTPSVTPTTSPDTFISFLQDNTVIIAAVGGGLFVFLVLLCCCCGCFIYCCYRRRKLRKAETSSDTEQNKESSPDNNAQTQQTRHYCKKTMPPLPLKEPQPSSATSKNDEDSQPVYVFPGGDTPVYDVNSDQQLKANTSMEPLIEAYDSVHSTAISIQNSGPKRSPPVAGQSFASGIHLSPLPSPPLLESLDQATYEYPEQLVKNGLLSNRPHLNKAVTLDLPGMFDKDEMTKRKASAPAVIPLQERQPPSSKDIEDDEGYEILDQSLINQIRRESHEKAGSTDGNGSPDVDDDGYVYTHLNGTNKRNSTTEDDGEYVYAWRDPKNEIKPGSFHEDQTKLYENAYVPPRPSSVSPALPTSPQPYILPSSFVADNSPAAKHSPSFNNIANMPLPSTPDTNLAGPPSKGDAPVDQAGYLILQATPDHRSSCSEAHYDDPNAHRNLTQQQQGSDTTRGGGSEPIHLSQGNSTSTSN